MTVEMEGSERVPNPLGPCRLLWPLGSGGAGTVYLAELEEDRPYGPKGTRVAVKVLDPHCLESKTVLRRFLREAELGRQLNHPSVVRTYDIDRSEDGQFHYLVMEYVEGRTLRELMRELGPFTEALLVDMAHQIAEGLQAIHEVGAAHRDLKPGNILITPDYQVKLMDLGVAFLIENSPRLTREGYFVGTLLYASPEQVRGEEVGPAADLYSVGILLYEAATSIHPFESDSAQETMQRQLNHTPPKAGDLNPQISPWLEELIACLMAKHPEDRMASAFDVITVLEQGEASTWWGRQQQDLTLDRPERALRQARLSRETAFIGRFREMQTLRALYREARAGRGQVLVIEGEAGVGKTRLVDELVRQIVAKDDSFHLLYGSGAPGTLGAAPGPMSRAVLDHFGDHNLERKLTPLLAATPRMVPGFVALLTGANLPPGATPLNSDAVQAVFIYLTSVLAADRTLIWVVDDLHHGSAEGLTLFATLAHQAAELPMLLIGTVQPGEVEEELGSLQRLDHVHHLPLRRLSRRQVQEMLRGLLDSEAAAETIGRELASRSDGNPFFIIEMVRELREQSDDSAEGDFAIDPSRITIPSSVRELLLTRLEEIDGQDQELLNAGAVQGFSFDPDLCARVLGVKRLEVLARLAALEAHSGVIHSSGPEFIFDHHHLQDVVYNGLSPRRRQELHRRLAEAYEEKLQEVGQEPSSQVRAAQRPHSDPPDGEASDREASDVEEPESAELDAERLEQLAGKDAFFLSHHYLRGGAPRRALRTVLPALHHLSVRYQNDALLELAEEALKVLDGPDLVLRCDIRLRQLECLEMRGQRQEQRAAAEDAVATARALADPLRLASAELALARYRAAQEDYTSAREVLERARQRIQGETPKDRRGDELATEILAALGTVLVEMGDLSAALVTGEELLRLADQLSMPQAEGRARFTLGHAHLGRGAYDQALKHLEAAAEIFQQIEDRRDEARTATLVGSALHALGIVTEAQQQFEHSIRVARAIGFSRGALRGLYGLALLHLDCGRLELAEQHLRACLKSCRGRGMSHLESLALLGLGELHRARHDPVPAESCFEQALELQHNLGNTRTLAQTSFALGRLLYEQRDSLRAQTMLEEAAQLSRDFRLERLGPLPQIYLDLLLGGSPQQTEITDRAPILVRAEAHLLLHRARVPGNHLEQALELLETVSQRLDEEAREELWEQNRLARSIRRAGAHRGEARRAESEPDTEA
ncbi:MAG: protein kinase [Acidobacteriota bacterium]|nr:protein kinase [Acidobacteriota bacterium]